MSTQSRSQADAVQEDVTSSEVSLSQLPAGRSTWSGLLQVSLVSIPVKAYPVVCNGDVSHFHQLHAHCGQRIRYQKTCPNHGVVEATAIVRGCEYAPGQHLEIDPLELEKLRPAQERALCLERFIDPRLLDPVLFAGRSLYLLPDGQGALHAYGVLLQVLTQRGAWGIGRAVMGGHRQLVLVRPAAERLQLHVLHFPEQLRACPAGAGQSAAGQASAEELQLAHMVVEAASGRIDWSGYRDQTAQELRALLEAKLAGRPPLAEAATTSLPLLEALQRSVAKVQGGVNEGPKKPDPSTRQSRRRIAG